MTGQLGIGAAAPESAMSGSHGIGPAVDDRPYGVQQRGRAVALGLLALVLGPFSVLLAVVGLWLAAFGGAPFALFVAVPLVLVAVWALGASFLAVARASRVPWWTRVLAALPAAVAAVSWFVVPKWHFGW